MSKTTRIYTLCFALAGALSACGPQSGATEQPTTPTTTDPSDTTGTTNPNGTTPVVNPNVTPVVNPNVTRPPVRPPVVVNPNHNVPAGTCWLATNVCAVPPTGSGEAAADPNSFDDNGNMSIDPGQCPFCMTCPKHGYTPVTGCALIGEAQPCQSFCHVVSGTPVDYCSDPPTSGDHGPSPEHGLGEHLQTVPRALYVHSMEHGAVIMLYNCPAGCAADLAIFRQALIQRAGRKVIMTPDPLMKSSKLALTSWTWKYTFDTADLASILCFIDEHENNGRENIPL